MKIIEHNDHSLELSDRNRQCLWGLLFAAPFLLIGLGMIAGTAKVITLECQRQTPQQIVCQRTITGLLGTEKDQIPGQLQKATMVKGTGVVLRTTTNRVELASFHTFITDIADRQFNIADRINAFLQNPQQASLRLEEDVRWSTLAWSSGFLIGGIITVMMSLAIPKQMDCKFDKATNQVVILKQYWLRGNRETILPLSRVQQLQIDKLLYYINHRPVYNLQLAMTSGQKVSLSVPSQDLPDYQTIADRTNRFLHSSQ